MTNYLVNDFKGWKPLEYFWLVLAVAVISIANYSGTTLDWITAITNVVCVILVAKGRVSNYVWGTIGVLAYGWTAYQASMFGNAALNFIYYLPMQFYGIYCWLKFKDKTSTDVEAKTLSYGQWVALLSVLVLGTGGYAVYLNTTSDPFPVLDAFGMIGSVVAMWLMVKQYSEQWLIWIAINIATVYMWFVTATQTGSSYAILAMWLIFLGNSFYGAYKWYLVKRNK